MEVLNPKVKKKGDSKTNETYMCLLNWILRANVTVTVTEGSYKCHLAIGLFAKYSVVFTTRRKDIRGCGRRGHLNCFSGGSALHWVLRKAKKNNYTKVSLIIKSIKSLNWPPVISSVKRCSLSFHSQFFVSGVFPPCSITSLFFLRFFAFNLLYNSAEMNRLKRHHYVWVTGVIINSLYFIISHDPPHGVNIVIRGERERNTKDKTQEKWRSSRKERIQFTCYLFASPRCFLMLFILSPFPYNSQRLQ